LIVWVTPRAANWVVVRSSRFGPTSTRENFSEPARRPPMVIANVPSSTTFAGGGGTCSGAHASSGYAAATSKPVGIMPPSSSDVAPVLSGRQRSAPDTPPLSLAGPRLSGR
jgi:hypothetical protein